MEGITVAAATMAEGIMAGVGVGIITAVGMAAIVEVTVGMGAVGPPSVLESGLDTRVTITGAITVTPPIPIPPIDMRTPRSLIPSRLWFIVKPNPERQLR